MVKAIVFDLDDTLYDEAEYVSQAFRNTAEYLAEHLGMKELAERLYKRMLELLELDGRGRIFDEICRETGAEVTVPELVEVYRSTKPTLNLYEDAEQLLEMLETKGMKTGLITDGCSKVQHAKISALGLDERLDFVLATDDFNLSKPQVEVYKKCLKALNCEASEAVYVGDNPRKDFVGARALGMKTFRIVRPRGMCVGFEAEPEKDAEKCITSLTDIAEWLCDGECQRK